MSLCVGSMGLIEDALEVLRIGKEVGEEVLMSWDVIAKSTNSSGGVELPLKGRKERLVLARSDFLLNRIIGDSVKFVLFVRRLKNSFIVMEANNRH